MLIGNIRKNMKLRITFRSEIVVEGEDLKDTLNKFENLEIFSEEAKKCGAEYIETISTEHID